MYVPSELFVFSGTKVLRRFVGLAVDFMWHGVQEGDVTERDGDGFRENMRADLRACRSARLHILVPAVLTATLALAVVGFVVVSGAVGTPVDFVSFVELVTINSAWLFGSLFALVGLFVVYPARGNDRSRHAVVGTLVSRWFLVALGVFLGSAVVLLVAVAAFDSFGFVSFVAFAFLTVAVVCAHASVGVTLSAFAGSDERLVLSLLSVYVFFVHLWDTGLVPTVVAIAVVGDPLEVVGSPPALYDVLLASSPYGAYSVLADAAAGVGNGGAVGVAVFALVLWLFVPPAVAAVTADG